MSNVISQMKVKSKKVTFKKLKRKASKKGYVIWEGDDSPEMHTLLTKMIEYSHKSGGRVIKYETPGIVTQLLNKTNTSSGRFLYIEEVF